MEKLFDSKFQVRTLVYNFRTEALSGEYLAEGVNSCPIDLLILVVPIEEHIGLNCVLLITLYRHLKLGAPKAGCCGH